MEDAGAPEDLTDETDLTDDAPDAPGAPPGWYVDPHVAAQLRWFDGTRWTDHVAPAPPAVPVRLGGPRTNPLAIASLVCSIGALLTCGLGAFAGVVLGHLARRRIKASNGSETGNALAISGLAIGYLVIAGMVAVAGILLAARS